jgi:hypothetical protein
MGTSVLSSCAMSGAVTRTLAVAAMIIDFMAFSIRISTG